jgi:alanine racemase
VGIGYATGYARALSTRAALLINGRRAPQVGRICMGMIMADVTGLPPVREGDAAWLVGGPAQPGERPVTAQDLADTLGTISYEVLCLLGATNPRLYG